MISRGGILIAVLFALVFAGSFVGTVAISSQNPKTPCEQKGCALFSNWLDLDETQREAINKQDEAFTAELCKLRTELNSKRLELARTFEDGSASDDRIRATVEAVISAHNALERRVAEHIIAVRQYLTPQQQHRLFSLCADEVRQCRAVGGKCPKGDTGCDGCGGQTNSTGVVKPCGKKPRCNNATHSKTSGNAAVTTANSMCDQGQD